MGLMMRQRVRDLPVMVDGELVGVVSMGDVAKYRLEDLEMGSNVEGCVHCARRADLVLGEGVFE